MLSLFFNSPLTFDFCTTRANLEATLACACDPGPVFCRSYRVLVTLARMAMELQEYRKGSGTVSIEVFPLGKQLLVTVNSLLSGSFLLKFSSLSAPTKIEELTAGYQTKKHSAAPPGIEPRVLRCVFSSDPAVSSSIFVGAEREENLSNYSQHSRK